MDEFEDAFAFDQQHRKSDGHFDYPLTGFGTGKYTLRVPSPETESKLVIEGGKPVVKTVRNTLAKYPQILQLRATLYDTMRLASAPGCVRVGTEFIEYAIALLACSYNFTDDELTMLLSGQAWQESVATHLFCGEDARSTLIDTAISLMRPGPSVPRLDHRPQPKPRQSFLSRMRRRLTRG